MCFLQLVSFMTSLPILLLLLLCACVCACPYPACSTAHRLCARPAASLVMCVDPRQLGTNRACKVAGQTQALGAMHSRSTSASAAHLGTMLQIQTLTTNSNAMPAGRKNTCTWLLAAADSCRYWCRDGWNRVARHIHVSCSKRLP
jgi:hypothetical protein